MVANVKQYKSDTRQSMPDASKMPPRFASANALQDYLLEGVSRTFALTIPQLPAGLREPVSNAYLLCRIVDTIEDEPALSAQLKRDFCHQFVEVVAGKSDPEGFAHALAPHLSGTTIPAEHELIQLTPYVIRITRSFNAQQREALEICISIMAEGMAEFQQIGGKADGLADLPQMDRYCYFVAGVVGEMLTRLFCAYSPEIAQHQEKMMELAVSFGQGLQMTNILKDIWDDQQRDACWLPQDIFTNTGFDLKNLTPGDYHDSFGQGLGQLIGVAHQHLHDALEYTLLLPKHEKGMRNFCLWALGMAVLTLRKLNKHRDFANGNEVKITRRSVKATVFASRISASSDVMLKILFTLASVGLPTAPK